MKSLKILMISLVFFAASCKSPVAKPIFADKNSDNDTPNSGDLPPEEGSQEGDTPDNEVDPLNPALPLPATNPAPGISPSPQNPVPANPSPPSPGPAPAPSPVADTTRLRLDFAEHPIKLDHMLWNSPIVRTKAGEGFNFGIGTGDGQRTNQNGVTWPDQNYYQTALGDFAGLASWEMRAIILYNEANAGGWKKAGWTHIQDMAEGGTCVDDTARGAVAIIDQYLASGDEATFLYARSLLNWLGYMVTSQGNVYNFAWLDAPKYFTRSEVQKMNSHYMARFDFNKRWRYPGNWNQGDPNDDADGIVKNASREAPPYRGHPRYSIFMNDRTDASGRDIALVYDAPTYDKDSGARNGLKTGIKTQISTSHMGFNAWTARNLWAFAKAISLVQKRAAVTKTLSASDVLLARFVENHFNRMLRFVMSRDGLTNMDVKQNAVIISALTEYLRATTTSKAFPVYAFQLPENGNTPYDEGDDRVSASDINALLNTLVNKMNSKIYLTSDWRNGIFIDNPAAGDWNAWGELEIYALAAFAQYRFDAGDRAAGSLAMKALDTATIAADGFYGKEAYHYKTTEEEFRRTKERITGISKWAAQYHNTPGAAQLNFAQSNMVVGLWKLAQAWDISGRSEAAKKRDEYFQGMLLVGSWYLGNNTKFELMYTGKAGTEAYEGRGAVLDAIGANGSGGYDLNPSSGGEGNVEGLRAMIVIQDAIKTYKLKSSLVILK